MFYVKSIFIIHWKFYPSGDKMKNQDTDYGTFCIEIILKKWSKMSMTYWSCYYAVRWYTRLVPDLRVAYNQEIKHITMPLVES